MLQELVEFYQQNELSDSFPEVNTTLVHPYKTISGHAGEYSSLFIIVSRGAGDLYPKYFLFKFVLIIFWHSDHIEKPSILKHHQHHHYPYLYTEAYSQILVYPA